MVEKNGNNTQDPEADYNVKIAADGKRKTTYGYKMHVNTDEDGFVKKMHVKEIYVIFIHLFDSGILLIIDLNKKKGKNFNS
jgi:hypothetical protein